MPDDGRSGALGKSGSLLSHYEAIARASHAMLAAARAEDWPRVTEIEAECRTLIVRLQAATAQGTLNRDEQRRRVQLLREILADDAGIRARSEPWLKELEQVFGTGRRSRRGG
jgi:flagellar protein FliT